MTSRWPSVPFWSIAQRVERSGYPDAQLLSVYRDWGVIRRADRDDNFNKASEDLSTYKYVESGNLVLNKMKTWQGSLGVSQYEGIVSPAYYVCSVSPEMHGRFLHHLLRSRKYIAMYEANSKGIRPNQWDLPYDVLRQIPVLRPSLTEQRRIADFLDDRVARIDQIIAARRAQIGLIGEASSKTFVEALRRGGLVGEGSVEVGWRSLPSGWRQTTLGRVLRQLTNGFVGPTRDILTEGGIPYIQGTHIKAGRIEFERRPYYVTAEWHAAHPRINLSPGDLLIVQTGDVGQVALVPSGFGPASCHALLIARSRADLASPAYLAEYLRSDFGLATMLARATGALHPHLEAGVRTCPVVLPPISAQLEIAAQAEGQRLSNAAAQETLGEALQRLNEYKQSLITAAVTGDLDVTTAGSGIAG